MIIQNVQVFGEDLKFLPGEIRIKGEQFADPASSDSTLEGTEKILDGEGCYAIPGLVDIHFHGCMGDDFCDADAEGIARMAAYEASVGVTSICPATMTLSEEELLQIMETAAGYRSTSGARLVGINMEGPFISAKKKGAQAETHIRKCDAAFFRELQKASGGLIKLVDIAPETEGAMEFVEDVHREVVVSLAHTMADYETASEAFRRGASHVTHLYNAMPPMNHRDPGVVGAARDVRNCHVELICDGVHIHPSMVRSTFAMFGAERVILISDSMRATGLCDGKYTLGGQEVFVTGTRATLADGTIAGSATNLMDCMKTAVQKMGIPLEAAVACATANPAKEIGIYQECGSITPGKRADLVLLDKNLQVKAVFVGGRRL